VPDLDIVDAPFHTKPHRGNHVLAAVLCGRREVNVKPSSRRETAMTRSRSRHSIRSRVPGFRAISSHSRSASVRTTNSTSLSASFSWSAYHLAASSIALRSS
jgi:hypothetical protein